VTWAGHFYGIAIFVKPNREMSAAGRLVSNGKTPFLGESVPDQIHAMG
jgi:hypothetical protein